MSEDDEARAALFATRLATAAVEDALDRARDDELVVVDGDGVTCRPIAAIVPLLSAAGWPHAMPTARPWPARWVLIYDGATPTYLWEMDARRDRAIA